MAKSTLTKSNGTRHLIPIYVNADEPTHCAFECPYFDYYNNDDPDYCACKLFGCDSMPVVHGDRLAKRCPACVRAVPVQP
jgi:hypothetical protein